MRKALMVVEMPQELYENLHSVDVVFMDNYGTQIVYPCVCLKDMSESPTDDEIFETAVLLNTYLKERKK